MIVLSSAYQQVSAADPVKAGIDPDNKLTGDEPQTVGS